MNPITPEMLSNVLELACRIQQIPAPTFEEGQRAAFAMERMKTAGLWDVQIDDVGNVLGRIQGKGSKAPLVFSAHMDTVFPAGTKLTLDQQETWIHGPGIGDNSLGVACLLSLPELLREPLGGRGLPGDIWLAATTGEEGLGNLKGIQAVCERFGSGVSGYISLEGMGIGSVLHRGLGVERLRVTAHTGGGHSWADYGRPSAVHALVGVAAEITALRLPKQPRTTLNIGVIGGGTSINTIASKAHFDLDLRSESPHELAALSRQVHRLIRAGREKGVKINAEKIGWRPAGEIPQDHPLVRTVAQALEGLGITPRYDVASTEANLPLSLGYPAVTIGLTTGGRAHSLEEYIDTTPLEKGLLQLAQVACQAWKKE